MTPKVNINEQRLNITNHTIILQIYNFAIVRVNWTSAKSTIWSLSLSQPKGSSENINASYMCDFLLFIILTAANAWYLLWCLRFACRVARQSRLFIFAHLRAMKVKLFGCDAICDAGWVKMKASSMIIYASCCGEILLHFRVVFAAFLNSNLVADIWTKCNSDLRKPTYQYLIY